MCFLFFHMLFRIRCSLSGHSHTNGMSSVICYPSSKVGDGRRFRSPYSIQIQNRTESLRMCSRIQLYGYWVQDVDEENKNQLAIVCCALCCCMLPNVILLSIPKIEAERARMHFSMYLTMPSMFDGWWWDDAKGRIAHDLIFFLFLKVETRIYSNILY